MSIAQLPCRQLAPTTQSYNERDTILYALGLGIGAEPTDPLHLRFTYEDGLSSIPTFATALGAPTAWMWESDSHINGPHLVALSHDLEIFNELPIAGTVNSHVKVTDVFDRGEGKGALIHWERDLTDANSGKLLSRMRARALARANGGFGGIKPSPRPDEIIPERPADFHEKWTTIRAQALIYRLSGDRNPLHVDPNVALNAGFERPILHGLCSLGIACFLIIKTACGGDPAKLQRISARYAGIAYPGETLAIELWQEEKLWLFRCRSETSGQLVLDGGAALIK